MPPDCIRIHAPVSMYLANPLQDPASMVLLPLYPAKITVMFSRFVRTFGFIVTLPASARHDAVT